MSIVKPFLYKVAEEIYRKHGENLEEVCIVFPNRRAGLFLKKYLASIIKKNFWAPHIFSMEDFIFEHERAMVPDNITLIFELFNAYRKYEPTGTIDNFYAWGEILLEDFNEIDRSLADAGLLFKKIEDLKIMESKFDFLNDEERKDLKSFLEAFTGKETPSKKAFIEIWEVIGKVYRDFNKNLKKKNLAYGGMLHRSFVEKLRNEQLDLKYSRIYFAGFSNMSGSEKEIIKTLYERKLADVFFDTDEYYFDNDKQEAGKNLRKFLKKLKLKEFRWKENILSKEKKCINIYSVPLVVGQIKTVCRELEKLSCEKDFIPERTAVVIPEESLLLPLLNSLPASVKEVNITLGYSLRNTSLFLLFSFLRDLQLNSFESKGKRFFLFEDVKKVLSHPYLASAGRKSGNLIDWMIRRNCTSISGDEIIEKTGNELIELIFNSNETAENFILSGLDYLLQIMNHVRKGIKNIPGLSFIEKEQFFHFYKHINKLKNIIKESGIELDAKLFWDLLMETLRHQRIPFTGEPLKGIQILGTLETRLLDFDNVLILAMNEGSFPAERHMVSFIPYNLRRAFRLPVFDDEQSGNAYIFYRLMQRAKNVNLLYNSDASSFSRGEKSRYITQVELELARINPRIELKKKKVITGSGIKNLPVLEIKKTKEVIEKLKTINYSPSALTTYLNCPMQFYLSYALKLEEPDTVEELMDASQFGSIFHSTMHKLYEEFKGSVVTEEDINSIEKNIDPFLDDAFSKELREHAKDLSGRNELMKKVLRKLIKNMLETDKMNAPFKILELEKNEEYTFQLNGKTINLKGKIDRVDEANEVIRVIDYKTSKVEIKDRGREGLTEYFDKIFSENRKEIFQTYFYSYLYMKKKGIKNLTAGICSARLYSRGFQLLCEDVIPDEEINIFEEKLTDLLEKIFDTKVPFTQTEDIKKCEYCSYKTICIRE